MSVKPILYGIDSGAPVRIVKIVAKIIDLDYEYRTIDIFDREQEEEWFRKMNPQHTLPTLDDDGKIIWESCAISAYLVDKYAKDDSLYPKDLYLRAKCNQRMFFVNALVLQPHLDIVLSILFQGVSDISPHLVSKLIKAFDILEAFLADDLYLAGEHFTIADISAVITIAQINIYIPINEEKHSKILAWFERVKETVPFVEENIGQYPQMLKDILAAALMQNKEKE